jgi:hypothetical protein
MSRKCLAAAASGLLRKERTMDTTKLLEEYEANHARDDYVTDLEVLFCDLIDEEMLDSSEVYSPEWAERQAEFLVRC